MHGDMVFVQHFQHADVRKAFRCAAAQCQRHHRARFAATRRRGVLRVLGAGAACQSDGRQKGDAGTVNQAHKESFCLLMDV